MNIPLLILGAIGFYGLYKGVKSKNPNVQLGECFFDKLATPISNLLTEYYSNSGLIVDYATDNSIFINTPFKELYGVCVEGKSNVTQYVDQTTIDTLTRDYSRFDDAYFFYAVLKVGKHQKQFIFSHNKNIIDCFADYFDVGLMSGNTIINSLLDLYLQNEYTIYHKRLQPTISVDIMAEKAEPHFVTFKKIAKSNVYKSLKEIDVYQAYKFIDGIEKANIQTILREDFDGAIWMYFDLSKKRINEQIEKLISTGKWTGNKEYFVDVKKSSQTGEEFIIVNSMVFIKRGNPGIVGAIGNNLKCAYLIHELGRKNILQKTPLKTRNSEFDFLVGKDFLYNMIASVQKYTPLKPDIYGKDKNKGFISYSFSEENDNPFSVIIATAGSGKSFAKQKMISQMIELDYSTRKAHNLGSHGVKVRAYDIGFSDEKFVNFIKQNPENSVAHLESGFARFKYNIMNINMNNDKDEIEFDIQFASDLISIILVSQHSEELSATEASLFKDLLKKIYKDKNYSDYKISFIKETHTDLYEKIINLGYTEHSATADIKEKEFDFLKKPTLRDAVSFASIQSENLQIREQNRVAYGSLANKLDTIEKLTVFSSFDQIETGDADFISMDLNEFKETSLFVPLFLSVFQKTYIKDRNFALKCKKNGVPAPKLFYAIEESNNFFLVPKFEQMLKKVTFEGRKYNLHLCFIAQNIEHIPEAILKNIDTKIFMTSPEKKRNLIDEVEKKLHPSPDVIEALNSTEQYELCVWYSKGAFNLKFDVTEEELRLFNTNPNLNASTIKEIENFMEKQNEYS